jgi:hypothetical protein
MTYDFSDWYFQPWIGPEYENGVFGSIKTLILGESHYRFDWPEERDHELTSYVVSEGVAGRPPTKFIRGVSEAVLGPKASPSVELSAFWDGVAFYNYVQEYVGTGPRTRPTVEAWTSAELPFLNVMSQLRPQFVLVCGGQLWQHVRRLPGLTEAITYDPPKLRCRMWRKDTDAQCVAGRILHPSSRGFTGAKWYPSVQHYIGRARDVCERGSITS